jgi:uncharacterized membrane protein YesL
VLRPYFRALKENFKQATLLWLPLLAVMALVTFDILYLSAQGTATAIIFVLMVLGVFVAGIAAHLFPLIARFQMDTKALLRTAFSLMVLHLPSTVLVIALTVLPFVCLFVLPSFFLRVGVLWAGVWFSGIAYFYGKFLLHVWKKHTPEEQEET